MSASRRAKSRLHRARLLAGCDTSKIFGDQLELLDRATSLLGGPIDGVVEAMVEMVLDERLLRLADRLLDGVQLLCKLEAGPACLDHLDDAAQMALRTAQPLGDVGMRLMQELIRHKVSPIPPEGISQWGGQCSKCWPIAPTATCSRRRSSLWSAPALPPWRSACSPTSLPVPMPAPCLARRSP